MLNAKKRFFSMVLVLLMAFAFIRPISAEEDRIESEPSQANVIPVLIPMTLSKYLNVNRLCQYDYNLNEGCAITCCTMAYNYYKNPDVTPTYLYQLNGYSQSITWSSSLANFGLAQWPLTSYSTSNSAVYSHCTSHISAGRPVIICLENSGATHYVIAYGYDTQNYPNTLFIRDPGNHNYSTLTQCFNAGWSATYYHPIKNN
ncbi:MAG: C39 family peptidase [Erysipelotrichaceae bacterium]|nr:C39 family peptidase [Erysipelotrichaceae bacterium]